MTGPRFFDPNILLYPAEAETRERAVAFTEDMSHRRRVEGVLIIDPFR